MSKKNSSTSGQMPAVLDLANVYNGPKGEPMAGGFVILRAKDIGRDSQTNSRQDYTGETLAEAVGEQGVLSPPRVRREADGSYTLVFGNRRLDGVIAAKGEEEFVLCTVQPTVATPEEQAVLTRLENLSENVNRKSLKSWEFADALYHLAEDANLSGADISKKLGISQRHVSNLIRLRKKLIPELWEELKKNDELSLKKLLKICAMPAAEQAEAFANIDSLEEDVADETEAGGKNKNEGSGGAGYKMRKGADLDQLRSAVKKWGIRDPEKPTDTNGRFRDGFLHAISFVLREKDLFEVGDTFTFSKQEHKAYEKEMKQAEKAEK